MDVGIAGGMAAALAFGITENDGRSFVKHAARFYGGSSMEGAALRAPAGVCRLNCSGESVRGEPAHGGADCGGHLKIPG